jgi:hypothetical protein
VTYWVKVDNLRLFINILGKKRPFFCFQYYTGFVRSVLDFFAVSLDPGAEKYAAPCCTVNSWAQRPERASWHLRALCAATALSAEVTELRELRVERLRDTELTDHSGLMPDILAGCLRTGITSLYFE